MVTNRTKKVRKMRGSRRHGHGRMNRGSGQHGGAGNAGSGKRANAKKFRYAQIPNYFGQYGFVPQGAHNVDIVITLRDIEDRLDDWIASKEATVEGKKVVVDLGTLGYTKLLSTGKVTMPLTLSIAHAVPTAVKKVQDAGGSVTTIEKKGKKKTEGVAQHATKSVADKQ